MKNSQNQNESKPDCKSGWTDDEKKMIAAIVWPMAEMQKAYGRDFDAKLVMRGWEAVLSGKYNGEQVCYALKKYALEGGDDFPSPKNINDILNPQPPRITEAQYVQAQKWQERNGFPIFSEAKDIIEAYRKQEEGAKESFHKEYKLLCDLASSSIKSIGSS